MAQKLHHLNDSPGLHARGDTLHAADLGLHTVLPSLLRRAEMTLVNVQGKNQTNTTDKI